jgi:hypothetical protein
VEIRQGATRLARRLRAERPRPATSGRSRSPEGRDALRRDMAGRDQWLTSALKDLSETELGVLRLAGRLLDRLAGQA